MKKFIFTVDRDVTIYEELIVQGEDVDDAMESFYEGVYIVISESRKVRDTNIGDIREE